MVLSSARAACSIALGTALSAIARELMGPTADRGCRTITHDHT
jgi:hypothetical protein